MTTASGNDDDLSGVIPQGFLWGTATSAHQTEGGNVNNDFWAAEHQAGSVFAEPSGDACDHYHRYPEDLDLLAGLGLNSYRFSVEWSRIEPEEGFFSPAALEHYRRMLGACHDRGLLPLVTFHHFTSPRWFAAAGGWERPDAAERFARFCEHTTSRLGDLIGWACTINEPNLMSVLAYEWGVFPPHGRDGQRRSSVNGAFLEAHRQAVTAIKGVRPDLPVGLTLALQDLQAVGGPEAEAARATFRVEYEDRYFAAARNDDYVGVQTYTRTRIGPGGVLGNAEGVPLTQMGYEYWPEALEATIRRAWAATDGTPILVSENGIATEDDGERIAYTATALQGLAACLRDGITVQGYLHWSALDNYEWAYGYTPKFGLIAVDRRTQERTVKPSGRWLGAVARSRRLVPGGCSG